MASYITRQLSLRTILFLERFVDEDDELYNLYLNVNGTIYFCEVCGTTEHHRRIFAVSD